MGGVDQHFFAHGKNPFFRAQMRFRRSAPLRRSGAGENKHCANVVVYLAAMPTKNVNASSCLYQRPGAFRRPQRLLSSHSKTPAEIKAKK
jgi:hypothetical protein